MAILDAAGVTFDATVPVAIIGAGACGLVAALAARDAGAEVLVIERDPVPAGSTALSSGMVPACGTRQQRDKGVADSVELMTADIQRKAHDRADPAVVAAVCGASGPAIDWLMERHGVAFDLVEGFLYPGHSVLRMHAPPDKTGATLVGNLTRAAEAAGADLLTDAVVTDLFADGDGRVAGLRITRPGGSTEDIGCHALVLACNGFGGNPEMVRKHIPEMVDALYFGHEGNQGDAVAWGQALGGAISHMGAYQGHGSVAVPHNILITWALMMEGGIQVNSAGERFSNEHHGYSEQSLAVLAQPGGIAWNIYDGRLLELGRTFEDFRNAEAAGALRTGADADELAATIGVPPDALTKTLASAAAAGANDPFGRDFTATAPLAPPYYAIRVTGALFHTQGGLVVDGQARVRRADGGALPNLYAGGGAACGVSGPEVAGYLSGNGLLTAVTLGRLAGAGAAAG